MDNRVRETNEQWDDVPAKVVGRRHPASRGWVDADGFQKLVNGLAQGQFALPGGVFKFRSFEEADQWILTARRARK